MKRKGRLAVNKSVVEKHPGDTNITRAFFAMWKKCATLREVTYYSMDSKEVSEYA